MTKPAAIRVLIVDDEVDHADVMAEAVARMGHSVKQANSLADAKRFFEEDQFDLVITDLKMDGLEDGFALLEFVRQTRPQSEVIVVTAHGDVETAVTAMRNGAYDFIQKPLDLEVIRTQVRRAAEKILLTKKNEELTQAMDQRFGITGIVGNSEPIRAILQRIKLIAPTDINVLILGESGTGKELVARAIHQNSRRASGRFVALNCAGLNENTLEDELFGHVRGAFTDARSDREGRFEYADGGTLFLDEIGDMPLTMQAKLLRVLQDRQITRIGSNEPIQVDVRFVAATNKDLAEAVKDKSFREDLYFRIKGATLNLPPLRQRRDDIPLLINHFIKQALQKHGRDVTGIEAAAKRVLMEYDWPGNVRQLENVIENMAVLSPGQMLTLADVPPEIAESVPVSSPGTAIVHVPQVPTAANHSGGISLALAGMNLAELERRAIEETLTSVQGNREQAAKILGIGERTLYRKIKEYGLSE